MACSNRNTILDFIECTATSIEESKLDTSNNQTYSAANNKHTGIHNGNP